MARKSEITFQGKARSAAYLLQAPALSQSALMVLPPVRHQTEGAPDGRTLGPWALCIPTPSFAWRSRRPWCYCSQSRARGCYISASCPSRYLRLHLVSDPPPSSPLALPSVSCSCPPDPRRPAKEPNWEFFPLWNSFAPSAP